MTGHNLSDEAELIAQAWRRFHDCGSLETLSPRVFRVLVECVPTECGYMLLVDTQGDTAYLCAVRRLPDPVYEVVLDHEEVALLQHLPLLSAPEVIAELNPDAARVIASLDQQVGVDAAHTQEGFWITLAEKDQSFGFVRLVLEHSPTETDRTLLATLAQGAVWELQRVQAAGDVVLEITSRLLSRAVDAATGETPGHSRTVGQCARVVAEQLGLPEERCRLTEMAACLHDYGKINALAELTEAPPKLDDRQRQHIRSMIREGIETLGEVRALRPVVDILLQCGEAWDGSGHPNGLKGEEISLEARIVAVVHRFYLALQTRPHRSNMTAVSQAAAFVESRAGKDFDPHVVACLVQEVMGFAGGRS